MKIARNTAGRHGFGARIGALCLLVLAAAGRIAAQESSAVGVSGAAALTMGDSQALARFGIDPSSEVSLARFLTSGISDAARIGQLPAEPRLRVQLLPVVMQLAVERGIDACRAPVMRLLQGDYSPGIERMINEDAATIAGAEQIDFRRRVDELLQYNAANSLSLLREKAARPHIARLFARQTSDLARVQYALAGATLGDRALIEPLLDLARSPARLTSAAALQALEHVSGEDFGASVQAPSARRLASAERAAAWWAGAKTSFRPDTEAIIARRFAQKPAAFDRAPRSLRDHLKYAGDFTSPTAAVALDNPARDPDQPRASRRLLGQLGPAQIEELGRIATDTMEDIDVRLEALRWLMHAGPEKARPTLKSLRRDPDPEIAHAAEVYLAR